LPQDSQQVSKFLLHSPPHSTTSSSHFRQVSQRTSHPSRDSQKPYSRLPGVSCWSLSGGNVPTRQPRSCFSDKRRREVKKIRDLGACLRCQFLKRTVSSQRKRYVPYADSPSARGAIHVRDVHLPLIPQPSPSP
jgi:hypothetical protein